MLVKIRFGVLNVKKRGLIFNKKASQFERLFIIQILSFSHGKVLCSRGL